MTGLRNNPILAICLVLLAIVLLVGAYTMWLGRDTQMRDAEADFLARMKGSQSANGPKYASSDSDEPQDSGMTEEEELAAWYAGNGSDSQTTGASEAEPRPDSAQP